MICRRATLRDSRPEYRETPWEGRHGDPKDELDGEIIAEALVLTVTRPENDR